MSRHGQKTITWTAARARKCTTLLYTVDSNIDTTSTFVYLLIGLVVRFDDSVYENSIYKCPLTPTDPHDALYHAQSHPSPCTQSWPDVECDRQATVVGRPLITLCDG